MREEIVRLNQRVVELLIENQRLSAEKKEVGGETERYLGQPGFAIAWKRLQFKRLPTQDEIDAVVARMEVVDLEEPAREGLDAALRELGLAAEWKYHATEAYAALFNGEDRDRGELARRFGAMQEACHQHHWQMLKAVLAARLAFAEKEAPAPSFEDACGRIEQDAKLSPPPVGSDG